MSDHYAVIGQNNRNLLVQSKKLAPFHEDITRTYPFEPSSVAPGQYTKIKLDCKHATDREIVLNDIRLRFCLDLSARAQVGNVFCVRGTDLIRELVVKINEDIVFKADKQNELTMLWLMNNHKLAGEQEEVANAFLMNYGVIPAGASPPFFYKADDKTYYHAATQLPADTILDRDVYTQVGLERHDGLPRLIYGDVGTSGTYKFYFDMSLHQLCGPIFHRLHLRRIEFIQIELMFEPWVNEAQTQKFLLFAKPPTGAAGTDVHPYSVARYTNVEIRQYRTTLLDGIKGFSLPDNTMLSWLMHRYSLRTYDFNFTTDTYKDIQLHDWEIRSNIVRVWWMLAPINNAADGNGFQPFAAPCEGYDTLYGVEVRWKNDVVLDLDTMFQVYRHYILSDNKRYSLANPYQRYHRLQPHDPATRITDTQKGYYTWDESARSTDTIGQEHYEMPIYHVDLSMNVLNGVTGAEVVGGIVNDTSDYVIRIKRAVKDEADKKEVGVQHSGARQLWVWIEYQTLVNLAAGSSQFNRGSQIVTKQLNVQN